MDRTLLMIGAVGAVAMVAAGAAAWFLPTGAPPPAPVATNPPPAPPATAPAPPPAPVPPPVAATPAPPANPDADRYARELSNNDSEQKWLRQASKAYADVGSMDKAQESLDKAKSLIEISSCLMAERDRGAPFYPALATCRGATPGR